MEEEGRVNNKKEEVTSQKKRKKYLHITLIFIIFFFIAYIFLQPTIKKGEPAPDFRLPDLNGESVTLSQFKGKVVFLNFWATWCPPCIEELPSIQRLSESMQGTDFVVLTVNIDQAPESQIREFTKSKNLSFMVLLDPKSEVSAGKYGITGVPETFLIDRNGIVLERYIGPRNWTESAFIDFLNKILNSGPTK